MDMNRHAVRVALNGPGARRNALAQGRRLNGRNTDPTSRVPGSHEGEEIAFFEPPSLKGADLQGSPEHLIIIERGKEKTSKKGGASESISSKKRPPKRKRPSLRFENYFVPPAFIATRPHENPPILGLPAPRFFRRHPHGTGAEIKKTNPETGFLIESRGR